MAAKQAKPKPKAKSKAASAPSEGGRPRKEIDYAMFERMCQAQCTEIEIAAIFGIDVDTLNARLKEHYGETFSEVYKKHSANGKASLRRWQFAAAQKGNVTMQIWLGKQYLEQKDKQEVTGKDGAPLMPITCVEIVKPDGV